MNKRPWPLIVLSILHILAPLGNLWMNAYRSNRTLIANWNYWYFILPKSLFIAYVVLPPLAGIFIFLCRRWSYWGYLLCLAWIFAANVYGFWTDMNIWNLAVVAVILLLDLLAVAYFVVPSVRTVYFDPKARWWETAPRFNFDIEAKAGPHPALIRNISVGGAYIEPTGPLEVGQEVPIEWRYETSVFQIPSRIVFTNGNGHGLQFLHTAASQKQIKKFIRLLEKKGIPVQARAVNSLGFAAWLKKLVTQGEGLFPKI